MKELKKNGFDLTRPRQKVSEAMWFADLSSVNKN